MQLTTQREVLGAWHIDDFCEDSQAWGWGDFDTATLRNLCGLVDVAWERVSCGVRQVISERWEWGRMCPVLRAIVRCAVTELDSGVDIRIAIAEYSKIACAFYPEGSREVSFVRSVINAYQKQSGGMASQAQTMISATL